MSLKFEYRTTIGDYTPARDVRGQDLRDGYTITATADDPVEPDGEGWDLVSACATDGLILWTWRRPLGQQRIAEAVEIADMMRRGTEEK